MGEHRQKRCIGLDQHHLDRTGIGRTDLLDDAGHAAQEHRPRLVRALTLGTQLSLEAGGDLERSQRTAVVELDALADVERPDQTVAGDIPPSGQRRLHLGASFAPGHERVEDLTRDERAYALERRARVERRGYAW